MTRSAVRWAALVVLVATVAGCASANPAEEAITDHAHGLINEVETSPAFYRGQLAEAGVNYLRDGIERGDDEVLGFHSEPGEEDAGKFLGWVEASFTRDARGGLLQSKEYTATLCLRFEIEWSDSTGGSITFDEIPCP